MLHQTVDKSGLNLRAIVCSFKNMYFSLSGNHELLGSCFAHITNYKDILNKGALSDWECRGYEVREGHAYCEVITCMFPCLPGTSWYLEGGMETGFSSLKLPTRENRYSVGRSSLAS